MNQCPVSLSQLDCLSERPRELFTIGQQGADEAKQVQINPHVCGMEIRGGGSKRREDNNHIYCQLMRITPQWQFFPSFCSSVCLSACHSPLRSCLSGDLIENSSVINSIQFLLPIHFNSLINLLIVFRHDTASIDAPQRAFHHCSCSLAFHPRQRTSIIIHLRIISLNKSNIQYVCCCLRGARTTKD